MKLEIEVPSDAGELFNYLATGGYLCSNHPEERHIKLYRTCETYKEGLTELWRVCGFGLIDEDGLYYFENLHEGDSESTELEKKLENYLPFIRFHIILTKVFEHVDVGFIFNLAQLEQHILENISLKSRYKQRDKESIRKEIEKEIRLFQNAGYLYCIDSSQQKYLVLNAFVRLLDFLSLISIEGVEGIKDEMQREIEIIVEEEKKDANA